MPVNAGATDLLQSERVLRMSSISEEFLHGQHRTTETNSIATLKLSSGLRRDQKLEYF